MSNAEEMQKPLLADCLLALTVVIAGRWAAGETFGAVLFAAFSVPLLAVSDGRHELSAGRQWATVVAITNVASLGLLGLGTWHALGSTAVLMSAFGIAIGGRSGVTSVLARLAWCVWLAAPCWINVGWSDAALARGFSVHPLLVLNSVWQGTGDWSHQAIAYRYLTRLGQDVGYALPNSIWPCVLLHCSAGLLLAAVCTLRRSKAMAR